MTSKPRKKSPAETPDDPPGMVDGKIEVLTADEAIRRRIERDVDEAMDEEPVGDVDDVSDAEEY